MVAIVGLFLFSLALGIHESGMGNYFDNFCATKPEATAVVQGPSYDLFGRTATCRFFTADGSFDVTYHESGPLRILVTMMTVAGMVTALAGYIIFRIPMGSPSGSPNDHTQQPRDTARENVATSADSQ